MKKLIKRIPLPRSDDPSNETSSEGRGVEAKVFMCPECIEKCRNPQRLHGLQPALLAVWSGLRCAGCGFGKWIETDEK